MQRLESNFCVSRRGAEKLANTIADGPLDRLTFEFFPHDEAQLAFKVNNWAVLGEDEKLEVAGQHLAFLAIHDGVT